MSLLKEGRRKKEEGRRKREEGRGKNLTFEVFFDFLSCSLQSKIIS
ncbi:MAG: hypothetical protein F6K01_08875 [Okeania sp. SIO1I7]|nr:hypothetical protein [Okeania sp. SIO1I7]